MMKITQNGIIKGGWIEISYDPFDQIAKINGAVRLGISIIVKTISFEQKKQIARDLLKSTAFWEGRQEKIDAVKIVVVSNKEDYAIVTFEHDSGDSGVFEVSLKNEYAEVIRILAKTHYMGKQITVEALRSI